MLSGSCSAGHHAGLGQGAVLLDGEVANYVFAQAHCFLQHGHLLAVAVVAGAEVLDNQMRGKRRLAYAINKNKEGIYVQLSHNGDGQQVAVLEKAMRLSEDVMRYLTVKQEGPLPEPRVMPGSAPAASEAQAEPAGTPA